MTILERLTQEFQCAIFANYGAIANKEYDDDLVDYDNLIAIAKKVAFYLDK